MAVTEEIRALLRKAGVTQYALVKAGIGTASARRLLGTAKVAGPVGVDTLERAAKLLGRELTTRTRR